MEKLPKNIEVCYLEVIVMPNGDVVSQCTILGKFDHFKSFLYKKDLKNLSITKVIQID